MQSLLEKLPLSALDQIAPRIYARSIFIFNLNEEYDSFSAKEHIQNCFRRALERGPFLGGQIGWADEGRNRLELTYSTDAEDLDPAKRPDIFCWDTTERLGTYETYEELVETGMPPSAMDKDVLFLSPNHPKAGESCPPVTLKVTEFDGGLFACFSTHHTIFDGGFIRTFLEYFVRGNGGENVSFQDALYGKAHVRWEPRREMTDETLARPNMARYEYFNIQGAVFPEYDFTNDSDCDSIVSGTKAPGPVCKMFTFSNTTIKDIQALALQEVLRKHGANAFVSTVDALSALVWVHVTRSRLPHISRSDKTAFTTAADARPRLDPPFPSSSWGNVYTQTVTGSQVDTLVQLDAFGEAPEDALPAIAEAAWLVRQAVDKVKDPSYIPSRIALAASLEDPAMEGAAFRKANRPDHAGLGCSVWVHMGADVDFGIPGTEGKADFIRKTWSANDGTMNIMQRRGMTKGDAPWEVLLAL